MICGGQLRRADPDRSLMLGAERPESAKMHCLFGKIGQTDCDRGSFRPFRVMGPMPSDVTREFYMTHVEAFSRLLIVLRAEFDGDLDMMLILSVIAQRHYTRKRHRLAGTGGDSPDDACRIAGINVHSIAAYSAIPRETVRRKVAALLDRGWIERDAARNLRPTARASTDLARGTAATIEYLRTIADALDAEP